MYNFKTDIKFHNELMECAASAYQGVYKPPIGYNLKEKHHDKETGLDIFILQKGNKIVFVYGGTHDKKDIESDKNLYDGVKPRQLDKAFRNV